MATLMWDASALGKRYAAEPGSDTVNALFGASLCRMASTYPGYAETISLLRRRFNQGVLGASEFRTSRSLLDVEVAENPDFLLLDVSTRLLLAGIPLIERHNLNSSDAAILAAFLEYAVAHREESACVLVASDRRLLRAALIEGLTILNPEILAAASVPAFIASLEG